MKVTERGGLLFPLAAGHWGKYAGSQYAPLPGFDLARAFGVSCVIVKHYLLLGANKAPHRGAGVLEFL